jgi:hypothetical protein
MSRWFLFVRFLFRGNVLYSGKSQRRLDEMAPFTRMYGDGDGGGDGKGGGEEVRSMRALCEMCVILIYIC